MKEPVPPFMSKVLIRKRYWRTLDLEPNNEEAHYLTPSWLSHGHWVLRSDGSHSLTRAVITNTVEPISEDVWLALEDAFTPLELRRRIRGKMMIRKLDKEEEQREVDEKRRREKILQEEAEHTFYDDEEVVQAVLRGVKAMQEMDEEDEGEILQTKIVGNAEVTKKKALWEEAIKKEIHSLFEEKHALRLLTQEESNHLTKTRGAIPLPSKTVFTIKPDPACPKGKRKCRIIACGNYESGADEDSCFAAGADAAALRLALALASKRRWWGINVDIRTAFLNAPWKLKPGGGEVFGEDQEGKTEEPLPMLLKPPAILVKLGFCAPGQLWEVLRAVYGFRRSPKLWKDYRDEELECMKTDGMKLCQLESEPSMWAIRNEQSGELSGVLLTYVDDITWSLQLSRMQRPGSSASRESGRLHLQRRWGTNRPQDSWAWNSPEMTAECGMPPKQTTP